MIACSCCVVTKLVRLSFCYFDFVVCCRRVLIFGLTLYLKVSLDHCARSLLSRGDHFMQPIQAWSSCFQDYSHFAEVATENYWILFDANFETKSFACPVHLNLRNWARGREREWPCYQIIVRRYLFLYDASLREQSHSAVYLYGCSNYSMTVDSKLHASSMTKSPALSSKK